MTPPLATQGNLEGIMRRLLLLEQRMGRVEVGEKGEYDFGSFVPALVGAGTAGTFTYSATSVEWTREGNRLIFNGRINITATAVAPAGNLSITGWPYAGVADSTMAIAGVGAVEWSRVNLPANYWTVALQFANGSSSASLVRSGTNNVLATVQGGELAGGVYDFRFSGEYRVA